MSECKTCANWISYPQESCMWRLLKKPCVDGDKWEKRYEAPPPPVEKKKKRRKR